MVAWCTNRFNIQQLYALPTLYLFVLYLSENKQRLVPLTELVKDYELSFYLNFYSTIEITLTVVQ